MGGVSTVRRRMITSRRTSECAELKSARRRRATIDRSLAPGAAALRRQLGASAAKSRTPAEEGKRTCGDQVLHARTIMYLEHARRSGVSTSRLQLAGSDAAFLRTKAAGREVASGGPTCNCHNAPESAGTGSDVSTLPCVASATFPSTGCTTEIRNAKPISCRPFRPSADSPGRSAGPSSDIHLHGGWSVSSRSVFARLRSDVLLERSSIALDGDSNRRVALGIKVARVRVAGWIDH